MTTSAADETDDNREEQVAAASAQNARRLTTGKKLCFAAFSTLFTLCLLEGGLALLGVQATAFEEDPWVGFSSQLPLFVAESAADNHVLMKTAQNKLRYFNEQSFSQPKPADVCRIFCLGGSTTYGHPYDDKTSFGGWLRELLPAADPTRKWEVINAGGISYASYRVAALMEELIRYQPDVFIVYDGHNEFLEQRTYGDMRNTPAIVRNVSSRLSKTRTFSVALRVWKEYRGRTQSSVLGAEVDTVLDNALDESVGPAAYHRDDAQRSAVLEHFRFNLNRMQQIAESVGANIVLVTPASKLRDCEPFRSQVMTGLSDNDRLRWQSLQHEALEAMQAEQWSTALDAFNAALKIDDRHAHTHFLWARVLDRLEQYAEARNGYQRALDEDVCPLRAPSELLEIMRNTAGQLNLQLVDSEKNMAGRAPQGIPGESQFLDHVHPTIEENRLLAMELIDVLAATATVTLCVDWGEATAEEVRKRVEGQLDSTVHGAALCTVAQVYNWAGRFEESGRLAQSALQLIPENAEARFLAGYAASRNGQPEQAIQYYREAVQLQPTHAVAQNNLGSLLLAAQDLPGAIECFERALLAEPDYAIAHNNLGKAYAQNGQGDRAAEHLRRALQLRPDYGSAHENLGLLYAQSGDIRRAALIFQNAVRLNPSPSAYSNLGSALANMGEFKSAQEAFQKSLELDPNSEHAKRGLDLLKTLSAGKQNVGK